MSTPTTVTSDQLTAMMNAQTQLFKDCIDIFNRDNSRKFDKYQDVINRLSDDLAEFKRSLEYSQNEIDDHKQRI